MEAGKYVVVTLHRPSNVDDKDQLGALFAALDKGLQGMKVVFPVHPRTRGNMERFGLSPRNIVLVDPMGYLEFNYLVKHALGVVTDSGGITEETTVMGIPCITLRDSTERPETCTIGTNELIGSDAAVLQGYLERLLSGNSQMLPKGVDPGWGYAPGASLPEQRKQILQRTLDRLPLRLKREVQDDIG